MKAAVLERPGSALEVTEIEVSSPEAGELLIKVAASGVCHSDRNIWDGSLPVEFPLVLGHEVAGIVEQIGTGVSDFAPGDHVVTCPSGFCGRCEWCLRGLSHLCSDKGRVRPGAGGARLQREGQPVAQFAGIGGFAEQVLVSQRAAVRVPDELPLDRAALLGCAVVTGMGAVFNRANVRPGQRVAVVGCGGVGLNVVQAARIAGAIQIVAVDRSLGQAERAQSFGATHAVVAGPDVVDTVRSLSSGGVDHAFEVVGKPETIAQAFGMLGLRGTATVIGVPRPSDEVRIPAMELLSEKRLQGTKMGSSAFRLDIPVIAGMYLQGRLELDALISRRISLDEAGDALARFDAADSARSVIVLDD